MNTAITRYGLMACATLTLAGLLALWACSGERRDAAPATDERSITKVPEADTRELPALGEDLLISLAQARNFHHKADIYLQEADIESAVTALRQIQAIPFPADAPEAEDVKLDAGARLAKLLVAKGDLDGAMAAIDQGIARSTRESFFLANLYTVKGEVFEARAALLDDDPGDEAKNQAREARRSAIQAFDQSIAINTRLQQALMGEDTP